MAFVAVDPSQIKFDPPSMGGNAPTGFVPVDPSKIQFDKPTSPGSGFFSPNRWAEGEQAANDYVAGKITAPEMMLAATGKVVAGSAMDRLGQGLSAITPEPVKQGFAAGMQGLQSGANAVAGALDNTRAGQAIGDTLMQGQDWYKAHPRLARNVESAADIAQVIPAVKGISGAASLAGDVLQNTGKGLEGLSDMYAAKYPVAGTGPMDALEMKVNTPISADMVRRAGSNAYQAVTDSGTTFSPNVTGKALDIIDSSKQKPLFNGTVLTKEQADINAALDDYAAARGQPMSMQDLQGLDSTLGDKAAQAYVAGNSNKGRILSQVQDKIRDVVQPKNIGSSDIISGSPEGADILTNHAIPLWSAQAKMQDIEKIITRANAMDNPATAVKTGFRNLMLNKGKMAQFSEDTQNAIKYAAKTGNTDDLLGILGSRLNSIAGLHMGPIGAVVNIATGGAARAIRTALKNKAASNVLGSMVEDVRPSIERFSDYSSPIQQALPTPPMLALPAPRMIVNPEGAAYPASSVVDERGFPDVRAAQVPSGSQSEMGQWAAQQGNMPFTEANAQRAAVALQQPGAREAELAASRLRATQAFGALDQQKAAEMQAMWGSNTITPEKLIADSAQKFKDAGMPVGQVGDALIDLLKSQQASIAPTRYKKIAQEIGNQKNPR